MVMKSTRRGQTNITYKGVTKMRQMSDVKARIGTATLVGGTVEVANAGVTATSLVFLTPQEDSVNAGAVYVSAKVVGESFTIKSTNVADDRDVSFFILEG